MNSNKVLQILTFLIIGTYFLILGTIEAAGFFKPISIAILLTLICIPICRKLESWGLSRGISALISVLSSFAVFISFFVIISAQISNISDRWPEIKNQLRPKLEDIQVSLNEKTGINLKQQVEMLFPSVDSGRTEAQLDATNSSAQKSSNASSQGKIVTQAAKEIGVIVKNLFSFLGSAALTLIYLFFFLVYRNKVKRSILKFIDKENQEEAKKVMGNSIELALDFVVGRFILIVFLAIIYSIGLSISGIENALLISVIAALLSLIPFIGNIIGFVLAMIMSVISGADLWWFVGVSVTFAIAQFIESYILEPYVVGSKVEINPLVTIIVVILGGSIWGIVGMILSIPFAGIAKIIFDATPMLNSFGYALGDEDIADKNEQNFLNKWGEKLWNKIAKKR
ncbi:AI-2E family transporter [Algoriphagus yeomjeoni]|uniref:Putative PurR-regulated permease PerM n=1 Tax=Algoriphagus yeomjeoni TaxID=291403 RepID=A0A327P6V0_9BACT|nr:AI-2E family transporter [Algoriphagus yeomjeoni]RAI87988.1 putative PurR-regulated permease PerM [Algoriphagus yeomjeoni]